jgi:hypothetical protein
MRLIKAGRGVRALEILQDACQSPPKNGDRSYQNNVVAPNQNSQTHYGKCMRRPRLARSLFIVLRFVIPMIEVPPFYHISSFSREATQSSANYLLRQFTNRSRDRKFVSSPIRFPIGTACADCYKQTRARSLEPRPSSLVALSSMCHKDDKFVSEPR